MTRVEVSADGWTVRVRSLRQVRALPDLVDDWDDVPSMARRRHNVSNVRSLMIAWPPRQSITRV